MGIYNYHAIVAQYDVLTGMHNISIIYSTDFAELEMGIYNYSTV